MFYINVWLTVNDSTNVPRVRQLLTQCCHGSRVEDGCVRFEVYHSEADASKFLLVEHWRSRETGKYTARAKRFKKSTCRRFCRL